MSDERILGALEAQSKISQEMHSKLFSLTNEIKERVVKIEAKHGALHNDVKETKGKVEDNEDRITDLEKDRGKLMGWVLGIGAGSAAIVNGIKEIFS